MNIVIFLRNLLRADHRVFMIKGERKVSPEGCALMIDNRERHAIDSLLLHNKRLVGSKKKERKKYLDRVSARARSRPFLFPNNKL